MWLLPNVNNRRYCWQVVGSICCHLSANFSFILELKSKGCVSKGDLTKTGFMVYNRKKKEMSLQRKAYISIASNLPVSKQEQPGSELRSDKQTVKSRDDVISILLLSTEREAPILGFSLPYLHHILSYILRKCVLNLLYQST